MNEIRVLSNGIRVVSEYIPYLKSVSIGVWVGNGSYNEDLELNGISHYIEHMLFKGTKTRTAQEINIEMDSVGGRLNAFTAREYTCFYTKTLDAHAPLAIDILSDMIFNSTLTKENMDLERKVIFEEIDMCADEPDEVVQDLIMEAAYGTDGLGKTILGTKESLSGIDSMCMREYIKRHYTSDSIVIAMSGHFDESVFDLLEEFFGKKELKKTAPEPPKPQYRSGKIIRHKESEQLQLVMSFEGIDALDERVYSLLAMNNIFGEGMSSRLFQNIREKRGLVYSVYAYHSAYKETGMFNIAAGLNPANLEEVCALISGEINDIRKNKITKDELERAKEQLKGNYILSYENTGARMQGAGRSLLLGKPVSSPEEVLEKIDKVSLDSAAEIIDEIFVPETLSVAAVGALPEDSGIPLDIR